MRTLTLLLLFCIFAIGLSLPSRLRNLNRFRKAAPLKTDNANELWFTQRLNHFDESERRTWQQRYFINDQYYGGNPNSPIFLMVGGEGAISAEWVEYFIYVNWAQQYGALVVCLEHRFYGESQPLQNLSTQNLHYLSSQQALADLAYFIVSLKQQYKAPDAPVITFGGSYPGNLAAWFRLKFPHLTIASVASSAPVQAELDFYQYLDVVDESLASVTGKQCDQNIRAATATIESMLQSQEGTKKLETLFSICQPLNGKKDVQTLMANLMGNFQGTVQYDDEGNPITIQTLCNIMNNSSNDPLTNYIAVNSLFIGSSCFDCSYNDTLNILNGLSDNAGARQWTYQTCIEFGYFQTTDSPNQPFGTLVPLSYYTDLCKEVFGYDFLPGINDTNIYYGGKNPKGATNILFVNGSLDPWHALGITANLSDTLTAILIEGTAHCADMSPVNSQEPTGLSVAQQNIQNQLGLWLKG